jgi:hypothetical protein
MGSSTAAGTTIAIGAAAPATFDAAGYAALVLTEIGGVESIGTIGANTNKVDFQPLKGPKQKHKGSTDYGSLQPSIAHDDGDAGQNLVRTASAPTNNALYSVGVTYPNGEKRFFQVRVFGYPEDVGNADSIIMAKPTMEINSIVVKVAAP